MGGQSKGLVPGDPGRLMDVRRQVLPLGVSGNRHPGDPVLLLRVPAGRSSSVIPVEQGEASGGRKGTI